MITYFIAGTVSTILVAGIIGAFVFLFNKIHKLERANTEQDEVLLEISNVLAKMGVDHINKSFEKFDRMCEKDISFPNSEGF